MSTYSSLLSQQSDGMAVPSSTWTQFSAADSVSFCVFLFQKKKTFPRSPLEDFLCTSSARNGLYGLILEQIHSLGRTWASSSDDHGWEEEEGYMEQNQDSVRQEEAGTEQMVG